VSWWLPSTCYREVQHLNVVEAECQFARRTPDLLRLHKSCLSCALHVVLWRCAIHLLTRNQSQYFVSVFRLASRYIKRWRRASGRYQRTVEGEVTRSARKSYVCRKLRLGVVVFSLVLAIAGRLPSLGLMYTNIIFGVETGSCWGISSRSFLRLRIFKYCEREREREDPKKLAGLLTGQQGFGELHARTEEHHGSDDFKDSSQIVSHLHNTGGFPTTLHQAYVRCFLQAD
jgi:hypothetical protein